MRFLVIGGTGFIGARVTAELLTMGHAVTVFHRGERPAPPAAGEIIGARSFLSQFRAVFARLRPDAVLDMILSSEAQAVELLSTFRDVAGRVIAASSVDVYRACGVLHGTEPGPLEPLPLTEESPVRSKPAYGAGSLQGLKKVFTWLDDDYDKVRVERVLLGDALPGTILRLPMVYGPGDPLHRLHPYLKRMEDQRPAILFEEKAAVWRGSRGYVDNVAHAIAVAAASSAARGRVYNVCEPHAWSEAEWVRRIGDAAGWRGDILALPPERTPGHLRLPFNLDQHWIASSARLRDELNYHEPIPADEALGRTIHWEREHPPAAWNPAAFDYPAEDAAIAAGGAVRVA